MNRTHDLVFRMINEGEFTPETALAEAEEMHKVAPRFYQDTIEMLVGWAWAKQDEIARNLRNAYEAAFKAEVRTAGYMVSEARLEAFKARWTVTTTTGEEPF